MAKAQQDQLSSGLVITDPEQYRVVSQHKPRRCLSCDRQFASTGSGNRTAWAANRWMPGLRPPNSASPSLSEHHRSPSWKNTTPIMNFGDRTQMGNYAALPGSGSMGEVCSRCALLEPDKFKGLRFDHPAHPSREHPHAGGGRSRANHALCAVLHPLRLTTEQRRQTRAHW